MIYRRLVRAFQALAVTLAVVGCSASGSQPGGRQQPPTSESPPAIEATQALIFTPFQAGALVPGLHFSGRYTGTCQGSNVLLRSDAYRCFLDRNEPDGTNIADPCFSSVDVAYLACVPSPTSPRALRLRPDHPLQYQAVSGDPTKGSGWVLRLINGQVCGFISGATEALNDLRLNYGCSNGASLYGGIDKSSPLWTIYYRPKGSATMSKIGIETVWY